MKNKAFLLTITSFCVLVTLKANNIQIANVTLNGGSTADGYTMICFDLSWDNSWHVTNEPFNWDAAWVFVKYRVSGGEWRHAWLNDSGHDNGTGTAATIGIGLKNDKLAFDAIMNPGIGAMVYRSTEGLGPFEVFGMKLRWNHSANGIIGNNVEVKVFAIEMVLVPEGSYWLGDSVSFGTFRQVDNNTPFHVTTSGAVVKCEVTTDDDTVLKGTGIWLDGDDGVSRSLPSAEDMNADFPTGYRGYYVMKYELSQGQYRDFLNTLSRVQQNARTATDISDMSITSRYVMSRTDTLRDRNGLRCNAELPTIGSVTIYCDLDGDGIPNEENDGAWLACNFLNWNDCISYLDWSGLRPMTELEYEKACRGQNISNAGEYAWGNNIITALPYILSDVGMPSESISQNFSNSGGNANYFRTVGTTGGTTGGPLRLGIFGSNAQNCGRISSGAGYYGIMELTGNLEERTVTLGRAAGRNYAGNHGDGEISILGDCNETSWPSGSSLVGGWGTRGGSFDLLSRAVSNREDSSFGNNFRSRSYGLRGCRSDVFFSSGN
jgi:formylglycine-generating enzyme required for sulfatase activity